MVGDLGKKYTQVNPKADESVILKLCKIQEKRHSNFQLTASNIHKSLFLFLPLVFFLLITSSSP